MVWILAVGDTESAMEIVKVCGITSPADALMAAKAGATAIGMIFFPRSPRFVRVNEAALISAVVPAGVLKVGVFVNDTAERIRSVVATAKLDVVQLHGDETPELCEELHDLRTWKALSVGEDFDPEVLRTYLCEAFLLDAPAGESYGGAGRTFPWASAEAAAFYGKVIIAGGLAADNVGEGIAQVDPWGVDASSRLESRPRVKDPVKVTEFVRAALKSASEDTPPATDAPNQPS